MRYLEKSFTVPVAGPNVTQKDWDAIFCKHDWTPTYTDRNSPQSYENGVYRGFRIVGKRCRKCGIHAET